MVARTQEALFNSSFNKIDFKIRHNQESGKPEKSVRFAPHDEIFEIPHINDLSDEEIDDVWMSPADFKAIRKECQSIVLMIELDPALKEGVELRGIEHLLSKELNYIDSIQTLLYDTVDRILQFGEETSTDISDLLASMCQQVSSKPEQMARQIALQDAKDART